MRSHAKNGRHAAVDRRRQSARKPAVAGKKKKMAALAQRYLDRHQPPKYRINVIPDAVEQRGDTWFIVAEPDRITAPMYDFINRMTEASIEMENEEKMHVFLVPVIPPDDD